MNAKLFNTLTVSILLLAAGTGRAQSAYSNEVMSLNPAGYWPMHETNLPAANDIGDIETNLGTIGVLGDGYYPDWEANSGGGFDRNLTGPITVAGNSDTALGLSRLISSGSSSFFTNGLYIPHSTPLTTLTPPFSVEFWYYPTNTTSQTILGEVGDDFFNGAGYGGGSPGNGWEFIYNGGFTVYVNNAAKIGTMALPINNWYYLVITCNSATNWSLYTNAVVDAKGSGAYYPYNVDNWTPISIGGANGMLRTTAGRLAEFAVYTNVMSSGDVTAHFNDASVGETTYSNDAVNGLGDANLGPASIYLRLNAPTFSQPSAANWTVLNNFGTTNGVAVGNGVYSPGTMPGVLGGPTNFNTIAFAGVTSNSALLGGVSSFGDVGNVAAYNPTGSNANFTVTAIFRGYPCDNRIQSIVSHGIYSWSLGLMTNGCLVFNPGNGNAAAEGTGHAAGDIASVGVYNDGRWHQVVAINQTNVVSIYVDGSLDTNGTATGIANTNMITGNGLDVLIGADPNYTNNPAGIGRQFAGQICDVAFFTNALTVGQVQALYNNSEVAPYLTGQPLTGLVRGGKSGTDANFGVTASGSGPLFYQWYFNTSSNYSGATPLANNTHYIDSTTNQLTVTNLTTADTGYYFVIVTNNFGSVTSILASLTVGDVLIWKGNVNGNWDDTTANWLYNGGSSVYSDGDAPQFDDTADLFNVNLAANVSPLLITVTNSQNAYTFSGANSIITGALTKSGTNTLTLAVTDSGGGTITLSAGTLIVGDGTTNGAVTAGGIVDNAALVFAGTNGSCPASISGSGSVVVNAANANGAGVYTLGGINTYLGTTILGNGTLQAGSASALPGSAGGGNLIVGTNGLLNINGNTLSVNALSGNGIVDDQGAAATFMVGTNNQTTTFAGTIQNTAGPLSLAKDGTGTMFLTGTNTFTGGFQFYGGIVNAASFSDYSDVGSPNGGPSAIGERASSLESSGSPATDIGFLLYGGTLQYTGSTPQETDRQIRLGNTTDTIDASGSNPNATLYWSWGDFGGGNYNLFDATGARTLVLTGSNTGTNTFDIQIEDQAANATAVTKSGAGTWYMLGASAANEGNWYSGLTTVSGGVLFIATTHNDYQGAVASIFTAGDSSRSDGLGPFTISDGATLGVTYTGDSVDYPALIGKLTVGSSAGATLLFTNIQAAMGPMIHATNTVFKGNCTIVCATNHLVAGIYPLLTGTNVTGSYSLAAMPGPLYYKLTNDTVNIDLWAQTAPIVNPNPAPITYSVTNNLLYLSWPADHLGWTLQAQTNTLSVGISTNWVNIIGSAGETNVVIPINLTNGSVFYRLMY